MSDEPTYDYVARGRVERLHAEVARLTEQLRIATQALEYIQQQADQGMPGPSAGIVAHDALIQMSVVK